MPNAIKAVLLDIGGVLVELDGMPSLAALLDSVESPEALHQRWMASRAVIAHETGKLSAGDFADQLTVELRLPVPSAVFLKAFRAWPRGLRPGALELLDGIRPEYVVAALSNTSAAHWERITALGLGQRFQCAYLSFETGHLKPARDAFHVALAGLDLHPSEVLFFDDSAAHVRAAQALGIDAYLALGPSDVKRRLHEYGVMRVGA